MVMVPPAARKITSARKMPIVPSVTMKGSMRPKVTMSPLARPQAALERERDQEAERERARIGRAEIVQRQDHHAGDEGRHGADGEIEPSAGDDEGGADRDDGDEGRARDDVEEVRRGEEVGVHEGPDGHQHGERDEGRERPHVEAEAAAVGGLSENGLGHAWPAAISAALSS